MGMAKSTVSGDLFRQAFNQVLVESHCVTLFDHAWATLHGAGYHSTVYKYSVANGYVPMEFEGRHTNANSLVKDICLPSTQAQPDLSSFRLLSTAMEERNSGLIVVHNAHLLSDDTTHLLARLVTWVERKNLDWKLVLFADTKSLDPLNLAQLAVKKTFPDSSLELDWKPSKPINIKRRNLNLGQAGNSVKYAISAALGLLIIAIGLKLIY